MTVHVIRPGCPVCGRPSRREQLTELLMRAHLGTISHDELKQRMDALPPAPTDGTREAKAA